MSPLPEHILKDVLCREDFVGAIASINSRMLRRASTAQIEADQKRKQSGICNDTVLGPSRLGQIAARCANRRRTLGADCSGGFLESRMGALVRGHYSRAGFQTITVGLTT
jgi:hypothetical protein